MVRELNEICKVQGGFAFKSKDFGEIGIPVIKIGDVTGGTSPIYSSMQCVSHEVARQADRFTPESGDTLIAMTGANVGRVARIGRNDPESRINQRVGRFIPLSERGYSKNYIHYLVSNYSAYGYFANAAYGSAQPNISGKLIESLPIPDHHPKYANQIGDFLNSLDDKIELNRRTNETVEATARAIFKDWFVDFGPTRAKIQGREPYLAPELWTLFPDQIEDETGLPAGWSQGTLVDIATSPRRGVSPDDVAEDTPYIGLEHMPRRSIALTEWEGAGKVTSNKSIFRKGEFLFGKLRPYFHKVGVAPLDGICSTDIVVVNPRKSHYGAFTLACLSSDEFVEYTNQTSTGTKMPRTSWDSMGSYKLPLPTEQMAVAYQSLAQPLIHRVIAHIYETRSLAQTRDLLLPKLMSGEIRLRDAEKIAEDVAA